jgi:hypothetical protein
MWFFYSLNSSVTYSVTFLVFIVVCIVGICCNKQFEISLSSGNLQFNHDKSFLIRPKTARTLGQNYAPTVKLSELEKLVEREIKTTQSWKARSTTGETIASPSGCLPRAMYLGANTAGPARIFRFHRTSEPRGSRRRQKPFFRAHTIKYTWNSQAYGTGTKGGVKIEQTRQKSSPLSSGTDRIKRTCDAGQHLNRQLIDDMGAVMPKNWWFAVATRPILSSVTLSHFSRVFGDLCTRKRATLIGHSLAKLLCK